MSDIIKDTLKKCPKCEKCAPIKIYYEGKWVGFWGNKYVPEHMSCLCANCLYRWNENPLDRRAK